MSLVNKTDSSLSVAAQVQARVRAYIVEHLLLGTDAALADSPSLIEAGILDSTGSLELVAFLEQAFMISVSDSEMVRENLDSLNGIAGFVVRKLEAGEDLAIESANAGA